MNPYCVMFFFVFFLPLSAPVYSALKSSRLVTKLILYFSVRAFYICHFILYPMNNARKYMICFFLLVARKYQIKADHVFISSDCALMV